MRGLSATQQTVRLSVALVEMTLLSVVGTTTGKDKDEIQGSFTAFRMTTFKRGGDDRF